MPIGHPAWVQRACVQSRCDAPLRRVGQDRPLYCPTIRSTRDPQLISPLRAALLHALSRSCSHVGQHPLNHYTTRRSVPTSGGNWPVAFVDCPTCYLVCFHLICVCPHVARTLGALAHTLACVCVTLHYIGLLHVPPCHHVLMLAVFCLSRPPPPRRLTSEGGEGLRSSHTP